ncbi:putative LipO [Trichinella spiralis]|uniref:putative LipO n=1 Tax=Trichinella spiralis TaxID=6334 RepID=UPI0001EFE7E8|nr:putative LipO [Trichinella spiralis]
MHVLRPDVDHFGQVAVPGSHPLLVLWELSQQRGTARGLSNAGLAGRLPLRGGASRFAGSSVQVLGSGSFAQYCWAFFGTVRRRSGVHVRRPRRQWPFEPRQHLPLCSLFGVDRRAQATASAFVRFAFGRPASQVYGIFGTSTALCAQLQSRRADFHQQRQRVVHASTRDEQAPLPVVCFQGILLDFQQLHVGQRLELHSHHPRCSP